MNRILAIVAVVFLWAATARAEGPASQPASAPYTRQEDIVYGRSYGAALTIDIFRPTGKANGLGVIFVVSGGWVSSHEALSTAFVPYVTVLTSHGYTVFAACHACQPKFQIPEIAGNINRAVRFVRLHAKEYGVDPDHLGITGASAGGHLSLLQAYAPQPEKADAPDPLDRVSSKVQAVACFFPPTDFLNYGKEGESGLGVGVLAPFKGAFDFREPNAKTFTLERITDPKRIEEIGKEISPLYHITAAAPPTMILHGDADNLVPIQQSKLVMDKLKELNIPHELVVKPGAGHGWKDAGADMENVVRWFDTYLAK